MARLGEIHKPVLVISGSDDRLTPPKYGDFLASRIRGSQRVLIQDAGHLVPIEKAAEVNRALGAFVTRLTETP
jgi:pimeloyl-ACP methyl ester carboxylesterase